MITNHTQLLNALIEKHGLKSYLEIGVQNPANNFDRIKCESKVGVDPDVSYPHIFRLTSDAYFRLVENSNKPLTKENRHTYFMQDTFDIIFIDGDHTADQVKRDFENSLRCLSDNGFIVIHDVLPENEEGTIVPRQTKVWWGDVYKWAMQLRNTNGIRFITFNIDNGCMLVWKDNTAEPYTNYIGSCDWETYKSIGTVLLNVTNEVTI